MLQPLLSVVQEYPTGQGVEEEHTLKLTQAPFLHSWQGLQGLVQVEELLQEHSERGIVVYPGGRQFVWKVVATLVREELERAQVKTLVQVKGVQNPKEDPEQVTPVLQAQLE